MAQTTSFQYDKDGRTTQTTDASGTTQTSYDGVGRVVGVLHPGSTQPDSNTYDLGNRVTTTTNSAGTTKTYYDALWRVVKEEHYDTNGVLISTTNHAYDAQGHELNPVTTLANGTQTGVTYSYDPLGRIATVSDSARTYTYDANGRVGTMTAYSDPGKTTLAYQAVFGYDAGTRTSTLTDKVGPSGVTLHSYGYSYDTANNRTAVTEDGTTTKYLYDNLNELTKVTDATGTTTLASYSYDANHNRATMTTAAGTTRYTYDVATGASGDVELMRKTDPDSTVTTYSYDTAGDLTQAVSTQAGVSQTTTYVYDVAVQGCAKRLCEVDRPDGTRISFTYDADGNRLSKTVTTGGPVPTTTVIHDVYQAGRIAYQTDGSGTTLATFTYDAKGTPASVQVGSDSATASRYYYVYNGHGDVVALTDAAGNVVATYSYDASNPFGVLTGSSEAFPNGWTNPYRYDGADRVRYDSETSLYWMSVRAYDPTLGRFLLRDPLNRQPLVFTGQPYVYGANNPLKYVDPSGQRIVNPDNPSDVFVPKWKAPAPGTGIQTTSAGGAGSPGQGGSPGRNAGPVSGSISEDIPEDLPGPIDSFFTGLGVTLSVAGVHTAIVQDDAVALREYFDGQLANLLDHNHWAQPGRWDRAAQRVTLAERFEEALGKVGEALIGLGFAVDAAGYAIKYFNLPYHPEMTGAGRVAVSIVAGLWHAIITIGSSLLGSLFVDTITEGAGIVASAVTGCTRRDSICQERRDKSCRPLA